MDRKEYAKLYYEIHKDEYKARYEKNKEKIRERNKRNKEIRSMYAHLRNMENFEEKQRRNREYYQAHKEYFKEYSKQQYAERKALMEARRKNGTG